MDRQLITNMKCPSALLLQCIKRQFVCWVVFIRSVRNEACFKEKKKNRFSFFSFFLRHTNKEKQSDLTRSNGTNVQDGAGAVTSADRSGRLRLSPPPVQAWARHSASRPQEAVLQVLISFPSFFLKYGSKQQQKSGITVKGKNEILKAQSCRNKHQRKRNRGKKTFKIVDGKKSGSIVPTIFNIRQSRAIAYNP